jgi:hypothetical protein
VNDLSAEQDKVGMRLFFKNLKFIDSINRKQKVFFFTEAPRRIFGFRLTEKTVQISVESYDF